ncbi:MAG: site-specific DNA-methyltransferase, partial [Prevotellaceae bacterium]|nr:site-specific DNA-methyltransferase [Prevotellaceae bacterium]
MVNKLILGDNLLELQNLPAESVDLIYLDPPFFSNRTYEVIWGDDGEIRSFEDRFAGGIDHYISWLKIRVRQMYRVLKPTGSIFLHCDWHANAEIKVDVLNNIFGRNNFRNEIVWCYTGPSSPGMKQFPRKSDTIFWYSKSDNWKFNQIRVPYKGGKVHSGGFKEKDGSRLNPEEYNTGKPIENYWNDIAVAVRSVTERIGYPTQKPEKLLERIIKCATNEGDTILDPFVGGGTTVAVAERLNRKWIGIDQSVMAIKVTEMRLK